MDRANFSFQYKKKHKDVSHYYESAVVREVAPADRNNGSGSELPKPIRLNSTAQIFVTAVLLLRSALAPL